MLLTLALWLPFGLNTGFWADGWATLAPVDQGGTGVIPTPASRPFLYVPWWIGYVLTPQSLIGSNLVVLLSIFGKGLLSYGIWRKLGMAEYTAFAAAALTVVFPLDNGLFYMGALSIHFALLCYLGAVFCLVSYHLQRKWIWLIPIALCLIITVGIYETVYPLLLFTPVLLVIVTGRLNKQILVTAALWYIVPFLNGIRLLLLRIENPANFGYQMGLLDSSLSIPSMLGSAITNYRKHFIDVWTLIERPIEIQYIHIAICVGIVMALTCILLYRQYGKSQQPSSMRYLQLAACGFVMVGLGFAAYLPTALRDVHNRTFFYSSIGAALTLICLLQLVTSRFPRGSALFFSLFGLAIGLSVSRMLDQYLMYVERFEEQRFVVSNIMEQVWNVAPDTAILLIDESPNVNLRRVFAGSSYYLNWIVGYAYSNYSIKAGLCYPDETVPWGIFREICTFTDEIVSVNIGLDGTNVIDHPYDHLIVLRYTLEEGFMVASNITPYASSAAMDSYAPQALSVSSPPFPPRFFTVFGFPLLTWS